MKRNHTYISRIVVLLCTMMLSVGIASAQSMLKNLAGKAAQKVTQKVGQKVEQKLEGTKVGKAVQAVKDVNNAAQQANNFANGGEAYAQTVSDEYPEYLAADSDGGDFWNFDVEEGSIPVPTFNTYADALQAWPALPAAAQLQDSATMHNFYVSLQSFQQGISQMMMTRSMKQAEASMGLKATQGTKLSAESRAFSEKMMAAVMALPEAEREKIAKLEDTEDPAVIMAYFKEHHPDIYKLMMSAPAELKNMQQPDETRMDAYSDIMDKVSPLMDKMNNSLADLSNLSLANLMSGDAMDAMAGPAGELHKLRRELVALWATSDECAKVKAMEAALVERLNAYDAANPQNDKFYSYPDFWFEERAKQNVVIDAFNAKVAERWRAAVQQVVDAGMPDFQLLAEQDTRLQSIGWSDDTEKAMYYTVSALIGNAALSLYTGVFNIPAELFSVPFVSHTSTADCQ